MNQSAQTTTPQGIDQDAARAMEEHLDRLQSLTQLLAKEDVEEAYFELKVPQDFLLSVVVPIYNEEATLEKVLSRIAALPVNKEIIAVDDCSQDGSREILRRLQQASELKVILKPENQGKGAALRDGFAAAQGNIIVVQDADLEYHPRDILPLLQPIIDDQADAVYGSRYLGPARRDGSWLHRLGNALLTQLSNSLTGFQLTDMETCYKAFRRDVFGSIDIRQDRFGFEPEVTAKLARRGFRVQEVPVSYNARSYGEGKKIGMKDAFNALYCIVRYGALD